MGRDGIQILLRSINSPAVNTRQYSPAVQTLASCQDSWTAINHPQLSYRLNAIGRTWSKIQKEGHTCLNSMKSARFRRIVALGRYSVQDEIPWKSSVYPACPRLSSIKVHPKKKTTWNNLPGKSPIYAAISLGNFNPPTFCLVDTICTWLGVCDNACRGCDVCNAIGAYCWKHKKRKHIFIIILL